MRGSRLSSNDGEVEMQGCPRKVEEGTEKIEEGETTDRTIRDMIRGAGIMTIANEGGAGRGTAIRLLTRNGNGGDGSCELR